MILTNILADNVEQKTSRKPKKSFLQRAMKTIIFIVLFFVLLLVFVGAFTQTPWFRSIVRSQIENLVKKNTTGELTLGKIEGNFITGFTIYNAHLKLRGGDSTEIASMNEIYARYSLWKFISGSKLSITSLILRSPIIRFVKLSGDSLWNYQHLLPTKDNTGPSTPFNLTIDVQNFRIEAGKLFVRDYTTPLSTTSVSAERSSIDWSNYALQDINLDMSVHVAGEKIQRAQINNLSFLTHGRDATPLQVHHLEFAAYHNDLHLEISGLHLITDRSDIRLTALMDPLNVINGDSLGSLEHSGTKLFLTANAVNEKELRQFLPELSFLEGSPSIEIDAEGEFGKLRITKGTLGFRNDGDISFSGELRNLHDPKNFFLDVILKAHTLSDRTLRNYVPGLNIADMQRFGMVNIDKLSFTGYPDYFTSAFDIRSSGGNLNGKGALDLRTTQMIYDAEISTKNINLADLLGDPKLRSDLNSTVKIKGKGTDPKTMQSEFSIDGTGTTEFKNYQIEKLHIGGKVGGATLLLQNTEISLHSGASIRSSYATINFSQKVPEYDFDLVTNDIPVSDFAPIFPVSSKVSVNAALSGKGLSANNLVGSIEAKISGLEQDKKSLPNITLNATLERDSSDEHRRLDIITSSIADLTFRGKYNIETIGTIIGNRIQKISAAIKDRGKHINDTLSVFGIDAPSCSDSIDLAYTANIKDLRPVAPFIPNIILLGSGKLSGSVLGCENGQIAIVTEGNIHNFLMRVRKQSDSSGIPPVRLKDTKFSFSTEHVTDNENTMLHSLKSKFKIHSDSAQKFSGIVIEKPDGVISLDNGVLNYSINTLLANGLGVHLSGIGNISNPDLTFQPDSLSLAFGKSFVWHNDNKPHITIAADGSIEMDTLSMMKPKPGYDPENKFAQRIKFGFKIKGDSISYAYLITPQLDLADIPKFFPDPASVPELSRMNGRVNRMSASMKGTFSHPQVSAELALRNFSYNNVTIDTGRANLLYKDLTLSGNAVFHVDTAAFSIESIRQGRENYIATGNNSFRLTIDSVPLLFSIKKYPGYSADSAAVSKREMSIRASGRDYPLDMFSPFVPVVAELHGLSDIELGVTGTRENILYKGSVDVRRGSLLLPTTNLYYTINGKLLFSNEEMKFVDMNIANLEGDDPDGRGILNGSFFFKGFIVQSFKLQLETNRLTVLSEASKATLKSIYGPLAIRTESGPLIFSGTLDRPMLAGNIVIVQGYLTLPQSDVSSAELNDGITYRIKSEEIPVDSTHPGQLPDTLKHRIDIIADEGSAAEYNDTAFEEAATNATPASMTNGQLPQFTPAQLSFQDKMLYDLRISIPGNLWFNINLSKLYGVMKQQLIAEIKTDGTLTFIRNEAGADYNVDGIITVTDKSTYTLVKEFSPVSGTISFVKEIDNPTIDITAEYTGQHKTPSVDETIKIKLIVLGTRNDPKLTMELYRKNSQGDFIRDFRPDDQVRADVLTFLTAGNFASDTPGQNTNNGFANAGFSVGSGILSTALSNYLSKTGFIRSVGLEYGGALASKVKLTAGYKDVIFNVGTQISSTTGSFTSGDFSVEIPFSAFATFSGANKFLFTGESHLGTDPLSQGLTQQPLFLGKILFRWTP